MRLPVIYGFLLLYFTSPVWGQCHNQLNIQQQWKVSFSFPTQCLKVVSDGPNMYIAAKEAGVLIYNFAGTSPIAQVKTDLLQGLEVMSLFKYGDRLCLALGNHFGVNKQQAGLAIINVLNPYQPVVEDVWVLAGSNSGAAAVTVWDNFAFLAAMQQGVVALDISNPYQIQLLSVFNPDISYPVSNPDTSKYNVRGFDYSNTNKYLYTCYDAGGVRIIDMSDKLNPREIGKYSLPALNNRPRAYNNIAINYPLAYVATDYCGMEILDISDTSNITQTGWWNPWQCEVPSVNNWFNSPGHTNELQYSHECDVVLLSSGKTDMSVVDVQDPANPFLCDSFGSVNNQEGTWGLNVYKDWIYLSYIFVPLGVPFYSNWSGVKALSWKSKCNVTVEEKASPATPLVYPNPSSGSFTIELKSHAANPNIIITDISGRGIYKAIAARPSLTLSLPRGIYLLEIKQGEVSYHEKIVVY